MPGMRSELSPEIAGLLRDMILACVADLPGQLPRSGVAKLLVGSPSKRVAAYQQHPLYGQVSEYDRSFLIRLVDELIAARALALNEHGYLITAEQAGPTIEG